MKSLRHSSFIVLFIFLFSTSIHAQLVIPDYQFDYNKCLKNENYEQKVLDISDRQSFLFTQIHKLDNYIGVLGHDLEQLNSAHLLAKQLGIYSGVLSIVAGGIVFAATFTGASALDIAGMTLSRSTTVQMALSSTETMMKVRAIAGLKLGKDFLDLVGIYYFTSQTVNEADAINEKHILAANQWLLDYPFYDQNIGDYIDASSRINPASIESPYLQKLEESLFSLSETQASELATPLRDRADNDIILLKNERKESENLMMNFLLYREQIRLSIVSFILGTPEMFLHTEQKKLALDYDTAILYREILIRRTAYWDQIKHAVDLIKHQCLERQF